MLARPFDPQRSHTSRTNALRRISELSDQFDGTTKTDSCDTFMDRYVEVIRQ